MTSIISDLESLASSIRQRITEGHSSPTPLREVEREVALVSEQLEQLRGSHKKHLDDIRRVEFYTEVDLKNIGPYEFDRQHKLKTKLFKLHKERRDRIDDYHQELGRIHERLFALMTQRSHLQPHGDPQNPGKT